MTKLEEEILGEILHDNRPPCEIAECIASVARTYIEKAFDAGRSFQSDKPRNSPSLQNWLLESGVVSPEEKEKV